MPANDSPTTFSMRVGSMPVRSKNKASDTARSVIGYSRKEPPQYGRMRSRAKEAGTTSRSQPILRTTRPPAEPGLVRRLAANVFGRGCPGCAMKELWCMRLAVGGDDARCVATVVERDETRWSRSNGLSEKRIRLAVEG